MKIAVFRKATAFLMTLVMLIACMPAGVTDETTPQVVTGGEQVIDGSIIVVDLNAARAATVDATGEEDASLTVTEDVSVEQDPACTAGYPYFGAWLDTDDGNTAELDAGETISAETHNKGSLAEAVRAEAAGEDSLAKVTATEMTAESEGDMSGASGVVGIAVDDGKVDIQADQITAEAAGDYAPVQAVGANAIDGGETSITTQQIITKSEGNGGGNCAAGCAAVGEGAQVEIIAQTDDGKGLISATGTGVGSVQAASVFASDGEVTIKADQIAAESEGDGSKTIALHAEAYDNAGVTVEAGSMSATSEGEACFTAGAEVSSEDGSVVSIKADTIKAESEGPESDAAAVCVSTGEDGTITVEADGLSAKSENSFSNGVRISDAGADSSITIKVGEEGIQAVSNGASRSAHAVDGKVYGDVTITSEGDLTAQNTNAVHGMASGLFMDIYDEGSLTVHVNGGVKAETAGENSGGDGVYLTLAGGTAQVEISEDVEADSTGIYSYSRRKSEYASLTTQAEADAALLEIPEDYVPFETERVINGVKTPVLVYSYNNENMSYYVVTQKDGTFLNGSKTEYSDPESKATIQVDGNVTAESRGYSSATAVHAYSSNENAETEITVNGNATAAGPDHASGVDADASGGTVKVKVGGDISAISKDGFAQGISTRADRTGETVITAEGEIYASSGTENPNLGASGITAAVFGGDSKITVTAAKGVTAEATGDADLARGLDLVNVTDEEHKGGTLEVQIAEGIESTGTGICIQGSDKDYIAGTCEIKESEYVWSEYYPDENGDLCEEKIYYDAEGDYYYNEYGSMWKPEKATGGLTRIEVKGDVNAGNVGLDVSGAVPADVIIEGTLEGKNHAVVLSQESVADNLTLTVWEIKPNADGSVAEYGRIDENGELQTTEATDMEKEIQYIIRLEQPQAGGTISAEGTFEYEGYTVAHENDTVILKVNVLPGYEIVDAFNGTDVKVSLMKDASGQYYLVVPRGGAVLLSVKLRRTGTALPKTCQITVDPNGGTLNRSAEPVVETVGRYQSFTLPEAPEKKDGTFLGWFGTPFAAANANWKAPEAGSSKLLPAGSSVKVTGDYFYTAVWKAE